MYHVTMTHPWQSLLDNHAWSCQETDHCALLRFTRAPVLETAACAYFSHRRYLQCLFTSRYLLFPYIHSTVSTALHSKQCKHIPVFRPCLAFRVPGVPWLLLGHHKVPVGGQLVRHPRCLTSSQNQVQLTARATPIIPRFHILMVCW
jgi:hypothetical protein